MNEIGTLTEKLKGKGVSFVPSAMWGHHIPPLWKMQWQTAIPEEGTALTGH